MSFDQAFDWVVGAEGKYSNDPDDPGGETNWGISKRAYPNLDIKNLDKEEAKKIYYQDYWVLSRAEVLPEKLAIAVFDCAVNQGWHTCALMLQQAAGVVMDGKIGPITLAKLKRDDILERFLAARAIRYSETRNFDKFGYGWMNRLFNLHKFLGEL